MPLRREDCINDYCPWSGDPVSADALMRYRGQVVGFCNTGCRDKFASGLTCFDELIDAAVEVEEGTQDV